MKYLPKEGLCLETSNICKIYLKNPHRKSNKNSKIQTLFSVLFGNENVEKKDLQTFHALKDISLSLKIGESLGIIGLNGSGKSTLMQIIAGTLKQSSGKVLC